MLSRIPALVLALTALALAACAKDEPPVSPTAPAPGETATPAPTATLTEVPGTLWLLDVDGERVITLHSDAERWGAPYATFEAGGSVVRYLAVEDGKAVMIRKNLDGSEIGRDDPSGNLPQTVDGCEIDGRLYTGVPCGSVSPDRRWMTFSANVRDLQPSGQASDLWALDLQTGARKELQRDMQQCTQCDASSRLVWSPGSGYFYLAEAGGNNRVFLIDVQLGLSRDITVERLDRTPQWSPSADVLIRPHESGVTIHEDMKGMVTMLFNLTWPARFDPSGRYLYSLASKSETAVLDATSLAVVTRLPGGAGYDAVLGRDRPLPGDIWDYPHPVTGTTNGFVAATGSAPGCDGTVIYANASPVTCVGRAGSPVFSPDGSLVALARRTGDTGPVNAPTIQAINLHICDIVLVDIATGRERVVARGALGTTFWPHMVWNEAGTHLLVRWPFAGHGP